MWRHTEDDLKRILVSVPTLWALEFSATDALRQVQKETRRMRTNTAPTNYHQLKNRCPRCGHKLEMKAALSNTCTVQFKDPKHPETPLRCDCRKHRRP